MRKILVTSSNSIIFAMFGNYKLKKIFEVRDGEQIATPPTTIKITQATTSCILQLFL